MYNYTKGVILPLRPADSRVPVAALNFLSGVISGLTATIVSHPFDFIRTRLQTQYGQQEPSGMIEMITKVVKVRFWLSI